MPEIVKRAERPYVALPGKVAMEDGIDAFADRTGEVVSWLAAHEIASNDAPAGRGAGATHHGHPDATRDLLERASERGLECAVNYGAALCRPCSPA
ncbi:hypothetical protein E1218_29075 [Kribbella turkmenica]|uniref:Uncharacterized protein n=1 Tax=Kribbella turkmenica TaxID=2530375 RepID=A0A4R4WJW3_9ACTN|nr:hypothetical protein [Kribbella turkmenica]TDD16784.1 hypothetical protein E1218_29075 [Kribbella turkmenica]